MLDSCTLALLSTVNDSVKRTKQSPKMISTYTHDNRHRQVSGCSVSPAVKASSITYEVSCIAHF